MSLSGQMKSVNLFLVSLIDATCNWETSPIGVYCCVVGHNQNKRKMQVILVIKLVKIRLLSREKMELILMRF